MSVSLSICLSIYHCLFILLFHFVHPHVVLPSAVSLHLLFLPLCVRSIHLAPLTELASGEDGGVTGGCSSNFLHLHLLLFSLPAGRRLWWGCNGRRVSQQHWQGRNREGRGQEGWAVRANGGGGSVFWATAESASRMKAVVCAKPSAMKICNRCVGGAGLESFTHLVRRILFLLLFQPAACGRRRRRSRIRRRCCVGSSCYFYLIGAVMPLHSAQITCQSRGAAATVRLFHLVFSSELLKVPFSSASFCRVHLFYSSVQPQTQKYRCHLWICFIWIRIVSFLFLNESIFHLFTWFLVQHTPILTRFNTNKG